MADERTDLIKRLAPLVLEDRSRAAAEKRSTDIPWYFININHPAMRPFTTVGCNRAGPVPAPGRHDGNVLVGIVRAAQWITVFC